MTEFSKAWLGRTAVRWAPAVALVGSSALFAVLSARAIPADIDLLGRMPEIRPSRVTGASPARPRPTLAAQSEPREAFPRSLPPIARPQAKAALPASELVTAPVAQSSPGYFVPEGETDDSVPVDPVMPSEPH